MSHFVHRSEAVPTDGSVAVHLDQETAPPLECCGCPDDNACRQYCVANYGARGGYCEGFLDLRCVCVY
ncbi:hypothetical protein AWW66_25095 [Micromonospora rosaria]|uniref:Invertebrate defensins family profile domain-containing protein n=1 Tax=Micromonospora rosaria TaxID=47874 RepID=A0A136PLE1_9ACTN|nr:hypothetical protein [Micromonospora rosaria]KXK59275.1 hypothetical protein AWW66_25095 [Micromonospora rosaria]